MRIIFILSMTALMSQCNGGSGSSSGGGGTSTGTSSGTSSTSAPCGNGVCRISEGESCTVCPADCKTTAIVCGNGACQAGENSANCEADCGPSVWPSAWATMEKDTLALVNALRATGGSCPNGQTYPPSPPIAVDVDLREAARLHSWDMAYSNYVAHPSCNGRTPYNRAADVGAEWHAENIAYGYSSATSVVNAWVKSTSGHCRILHSPYVHGAIGYAENSANRGYWSLELR